MNHRISLGLLLFLVVTVLGCQPSTQIGVDEKQSQGFRVRTYFNETGNVEFLIASQGSTSIVALPRAAIARRNTMGDDDLSCLANCTKIEDLEARLNCILLCPATKQWQVSVLFAEK
jgi:hypothetical protein